MTTMSLIQELPFNGQPVPVIEPDAKELVRLVARGWRQINGIKTKPGTAPSMADSRLCLHELVKIMAKPRWHTVFSHYAQLCMSRDGFSNHHQRAVERAFLRDEIREAISAEIARIAVPV